MQIQPLTVHQAFYLSQPRTLFSQLEGYKVPKLQVDPARMIKERQMSKIEKGGKPRIKSTKRGSFIQEEVKVHKIVPGPGKYPFANRWPLKANIKIRQFQRSTFIKDIFRKQKKQKTPAPGFYNVFKSIKELQQEANRYSAKKVKPQDRKTFLDSIKFDATANPGVGNYNIRNRAQSQMSFSKYKTKPEDWRKKHSQSYLKQKGRKRIPTATSYSPKPSDYSLFSTMGKSKTKNGFGKNIRFKTSISGSGITPMKYSVLQQWRGKNKKIEKHGLEVLYKIRTQTSVYHD